MQCSAVQWEAVQCSAVPFSAVEQLVDIRGGIYIFTSRPSEPGKARVGAGIKGQLATRQHMEGGDHHQLVELSIEHFFVALISNNYNLLSLIKL